MSKQQARPTEATNKRDIILLVSVPLVLMGILAAVVYLPQLLARPAHDFIYATCNSYRCDNTVKIVDGKVQPQLKAEVHTPGEGGITLEEHRRMQNDQQNLHYYDVERKTSRPITMDEAKNLTLDTSRRSPDGYTLTRESNSSGFLFWDSSSSGWVLKDGMKKQSVDITTGSYYYDNVTFLGWVK